MTFRYMTSSQLIDCPNPMQEELPWTGLHRSITKPDWEGAKRYMECLKENGYSPDQYCTVSESLNDKCCATDDDYFHKPDLPLLGPSYES